jgi:hypothetical protein
MYYPETWLEFGPMMLDPSILATEAGIRWVLSAPPLDVPIGLPRAFISVVREGPIDRGPLDYFGLSRMPWSLIREASMHLSEGRFDDRYRAFDEGMTAKLGPVVHDPLVAEIVGEEYAFLLMHSTVLSRVKKPFHHMYRAGASFVQLVTRKTLHLPTHHALTTTDFRRAGIKWIAVGGSAAASLVNPVVAATIGIGTGAFLLLDP